MNFSKQLENIIILDWEEKRREEKIQKHNYPEKNSNFGGDNFNSVKKKKVSQDK